MRYDSLIPKTLLRATVDTDNTTGQPQLPAEKRTEAIAWLRRVLVDVDALKAHVAYLREQFSSAAHPGQDECSSHSLRMIDWSINALYLGFRHNRPLPQGDAFNVAGHGLEILDDAVLARLLLNPVALADLSSLIEAKPSAYWRAALGEVGRERWAASGRPVPPVGAPSPPGPPAFAKGPAPVASRDESTEIAAAASATDTLVETVGGHRRLPAEEKQRLEQLLPYLLQNVGLPADKARECLAFVEEQLTKLPTEKQAPDAVPRLVEEFARR